AISTSSVPTSATSQSTSFPPGLRTRKHSRNRRALSGMRWADSREKTRSNEASGSPLSRASRSSKRTRSDEDADEDADEDEGRARARARAISRPTALVE